MGVDDEAEPDARVDAPLDRAPGAKERLVHAQRRGVDAGRADAALRPPARDAERVERVQPLDAQPRGLDDRAQPPAGVAAGVARAPVRATADAAVGPPG